ncbi:MAG TPA: hypothetical protein VMV86_06040, partial [Methanosarcinales archaeon]|nr:hypothetical protein [Methanosarcinales archaeon]
RKWEKEGCPYVHYEGFNCGLCGAWEAKPFSIPKYKSDGRWADTWGMCDKCIKDYCGEEDKEITKVIKVIEIVSKVIRISIAAAAIIFALFLATKPNINASIPILLVIGGIVLWGYKAFFPKRNK